MAILENIDYYKLQIEFLKKQVEWSNREIEWLGKQIEREKNELGYSLDGEKYIRCIHEEYRKRKKYQSKILEYEQLLTK